MSTAEEKLAKAGVFKGAEGLRQFAECSEFWDRQMYGTRLYFDDHHYLHRDVLRAAVQALDSSPKVCAPKAMAEQSLEGKLFNYFVERYGITLLCSEITDIKRMVADQICIDLQKSLEDKDILRSATNGTALYLEIANART